MTVTRRRFLQTAGTGVLAGGIMPSQLWASTEVKLGDIRIDSLSDGHLVLPRDFVFGPMPQDDLVPILAAHGIGEGNLTPDCNVTLLRFEGNVVLFDVGAGAAFQDSAGKLVGALEAVGVAPEDVTHVVFTHGHPDHLWGVLDDFDDPLFYEAEHMMGRAEWDYWMDPNTADAIGEARLTMALGARRRLEALQDSFTLIDDGQEILPGVAAHLTAGHTAGHMGFEIRSGSEGLMVVGDAIGNHHVAFARPDWRSGSDQDADIAAKTRLALLDRLSHEQMPLIGFHLPNGGIGRVEKTVDGYRFVPEGM